MKDRFIIHDRDRIYSRDLDAGLKALGLTVLKTPPKALKANAICERWIGSARRECLDFMIPISEAHIRQTLKCWVQHYNRARPHSNSWTRNTRSEFAEGGATSPTTPHSKGFPSCSDIDSQWPASRIPAGKNRRVKDVEQLNVFFADDNCVCSSYPEIFRIKIT